MAKQSLKVILKNLTAFIAGFVDNKNNPTGVTAEQLGVYTKDEVNKLLASKLKIADVPISYWGESMDVQPAFNVTTGGFLHITDPVPVMLGGVRTILEPVDMSPSVAPGVTSYLTVEASAGKVRYRMSTTVPVESSAVMYIGRFIGITTTVSVEGMTPVIRIANYRLSNTRRGSAIPITDGSGGLKW